MQSNHSDTFVVVGRISRPYGVRGWNHLTSFTDPQDNLASYKPLALNSGKSETSAWQICQELEFRKTNRGLLVCINASNNREDASRYVNQLIGTQRSCLPVEIQSVLSITFQRMEHMKSFISGATIKKPVCRLFLSMCQKWCLVSH